MLSSAKRDGGCGAEGGFRAETEGCLRVCGCCGGLERLRGALTGEGVRFRERELQGRKARG